MRQHAVAVARAVDCPVVLYNIPPRSVVDLAVHTTAQICEQAPNVAAVKDATGNVQRCQELRVRLGDRLAVMCGDDSLTLPMMAAGATGVISVTSNVAPGRVKEVTDLMSRGELAAARRAHLALLELHAAMFVEPNPVPCKLALSMLGKMQPDVRLPLVAPSELGRARIAAALSEAGILAGQS
jgi:4-hydroxy-tetrahydrodipicolinate synthase